MKTNEKKINVVDCGCGDNVKKEVNNLVKEGTKPTEAQHDKKKDELEAAFKKSKK